MLQQILTSVFCGILLFSSIYWIWKSKCLATQCISFRFNTSELQSLCCTEKRQKSNHTTRTFCFLSQFICSIHSVIAYLWFYTFKNCCLKLFLIFAYKLLWRKNHKKIKLANLGIYSFAYGFEVATVIDYCRLHDAVKMHVNCSLDRSWAWFKLNRNYPDLCISFGRHFVTTGLNCPIMPFYFSATAYFCCCRPLGAIAMKAILTF